MDILKVIENDHAEAMELVDRLEKMVQQPSVDADRLSNELVISVLTHAKAEEKALYEICRGHEDPELRDFSIKGYIEHKIIEDTLKRLFVIKPGNNGEFKATLAVAKDLLQRHAEQEEEKEMFPKFKRSFSEDQLNEMGQVMVQAKQNLRPKMADLLDNVPVLKKKKAKKKVAAKSMIGKKAKSTKRGSKTPSKARSRGTASRSATLQ